MRREPRVVTLAGLDAVRTLRAEVMGLALAADREPGAVRVLRLEAPRMTLDRIAAEWGKATSETQAGATSRPRGDRIATRG